MKTAKLFKHGGSQAVRLPKEFRFSGEEVLIEKRDDEIVLRQAPKAGSLTDCVREMQDRYPEGSDFPDREQPSSAQERDFDFDS